MVKDVLIKILKSDTKNSKIKSKIVRMIRKEKRKKEKEKKK